MQGDWNWVMNSITMHQIMTSTKMVAKNMIGQFKEKKSCTYKNFVGRMKKFKRTLIKRKLFKE